MQSPHEAADFLELLHENLTVMHMSNSTVQANASDLVAEAYVRFFKYPDDLTEDHQLMPWVPLFEVKHLVGPHLERLIGWMDLPHGTPSAAAPAAPDDSQRNVPQDDDERFIVGLVLTYYRRHPQRARARLLDLLGEVLTPSSSAPVKPGAPRPPADDGRDLWSKTQAAVKPLKPKR